MKRFIPLFLLLAVMSMPVTARGGEHYVIRWALNHQPVNYFDAPAKEFKRAVEARTHGKVEVVIDSSVEAEEPALITMLRANSIQMSQVLTSHLTSLNPDFELFQLPFLFDSDDHLTRFSATASGRGLLRSLDEKGLFAAGYSYSGGLMGIFGPKIETLEDVKDRAYVAEECTDKYIQAFERIGIHASRSTAELPAYDALTAKTAVFGESIPWLMTKVLDTPDLKEVYFNRTAHRILTRVVLLSGAFLGRLPQDLRDIVTEEARNVANQERQTAIAATRDISEKFASETHRFNEWTPEQRAHDRALFEPYYRMFAEKHDAKLLRAVEAVRSAGHQPKKLKD